MRATVDLTHPALRTPEWAEQHKEEQIIRRQRAYEIRRAVGDRNFLMALDLIADGVTFSVPHFCILERAFPLMTERERAWYLRYVWCRSKSRVSSARALRLFRGATSLRETVPIGWPDEVRVFRGALSASWPIGRAVEARYLYRRSLAKVTRGIAWTTDRGIAMKFAIGMPGDVGCLAVAMVPRVAVLAYFQDEDEIEIKGHRFPVDGFHEHECIIDPADVQQMTYERVENTEPSKQA
jgi:hypothetical protein